MQLASRLLFLAPGLSALAAFAGCGTYEYRFGAHSAIGGAGGSPDASAGGFGGSEAAPGGSDAGAAGDGTAGAIDAPTGLLGWAATSGCGINGTTGGQGGPTRTVRTASELLDAADTAGPLVIEVSGSIDLAGSVLELSSDQSMIGVNGAEIRGAVRLSGIRNVVVQNIKFDGATSTESLDALEVSGATCVWLDHCDFVDGADDNLDIVRGSDLVTVSWSKFYYELKTNSHRLSTICGNSATDTPGKLNITFHHNWWGPHIIEGMPNARYGKIHIFNSYFSSAGDNSCIGAGYMVKLLVQNNVFEGVSNPIAFRLDEDPNDPSVHTAEVVQSGNDYTTATGDRVSRGIAFTPPYPFALQTAQAAETSIMAEAGAH